MQKGIGKKGISDSENKRKYVLFSASKIAKNRHAISEVVTTVLMVLLALGAILLVWFLVRNLISNAGEQIDLSKLTLSFTIPGNSVYVNQPLKSVSFVVQRQAGAGTVSGLKVIVTDTSGQSVTQNVAVALGELESKSVSVSYASSSLGQIAKVSVAPIVKSASGNEQTGSVAAEYSVTSANIHNMVLKFDGPNEFAQITNFNGLPSSKITVSAWVNVNQVGAWHDFVWHDWGQNGGWLIFTDVQVGFDIFPQGAAISYSSMNSNQWYHITGVWDGNFRTIYVNGVQVGSPVSDTQALSLDNAGEVRVGYDDPNAPVGPSKLLDFTRKISDVRIYNQVLSADEIKNLPYDNLGTIERSNLVGWWKLDGDFKDSSGKGNDLSAVSGATPEWVAG